MIRALLVDDEAPARDRMRDLLASLGDVEIVGEAGDGGAALRQVADARPDLVFLDIEMPGLTGLEVAMAMAHPRPRIVFCTAYDQYAVEAFEHHASAYLLKPVSRVRLTRVLDRLRADIAEERRRRRETRDASAAQAHLLPGGAATRRLRAAGRCRPVGGVGGDYYDFLPLGDDGLALALGDVSGKGLFAGLLMAGLQARVQSLAATLGGDPRSLVREVDGALCATTQDGRYATLFYGVWHDGDGTLRYVNAGHPPALVVRGDGAIERLGPTGSVVGLLGDRGFDEAAVRLSPGDTLLLYSDGASEAEDAAGLELGPDGLAATVLACRSREPGAVVDAVFGAVLDRLDGRPPADDVTVVAARVEEPAR